MEGSEARLAVSGSFRNKRKILTNKNDREMDEMDKMDKKLNQTDRKDGQTDRKSNQSEKKMNSKKKQNKLIYIILLLVFAAALVVIIVCMAKKHSAEKKAQEEYQDLAAKTETDKTGTEEAEDAGEGNKADDVLAELGIEVPAKEIDWTALQETNEDIYAWIYIPGTKVDYPIVQHKTDDTYYLEHNLDGSEGYPGCIYTELWNYKGFQDRNTVLYGHNMKDGTMFGTLHNYEDETFFQENRYAFIYRPEKVLVYDIFAAYEYDDEHLLYHYNLTSDAGYQEYLDKVFQVRDMGAHFREGVEVGIQNHIITLSTCIGDKPENRYLVQGVLVNDPGLYEDAAGE